MTPTYTAIELRRMCEDVETIEEYKILSDLIGEEVVLYSHEDLYIIAEASIILLTRAALKFSLKGLE